MYAASQPACDELITTHLLLYAALAWTDGSMAGARPNYVVCEQRGRSEPQIDGSPNRCRVRLMPGAVARPGY